MMDDQDICFVGDRPGAVNFIAWDRAAALALVGAKLAGNPKTDTHDNSTAEEIIGAGLPYMAFQGGIPLALVVLEKINWSGGRELEIRAAVALSGRQDATECILPHIESVFAHDCNSVAVYTRRAGLVKKLARVGYNESAKILRKKLCRAA